ncbi:MAG: hypothetical protein KAW56_17740 [Candidatus Marinimicrobia bacterium]|nr:hypothetical protein [Candidatus Neomarinimicrobiota bacterium]
MNNYEIRSIRPRVNIWNDVLEGDDFINSIVSIETSKDIREIAGRFSIVLKPMKGKYGIQSQENYWYDQFDPQDVVGITFHGDKYKEKGKDKGAQFLGIVDSVNKASSFRKDNPYRRTIIAGRDFGSLILDDDLVYAPEMFFEVNEDRTVKSEEIAKVFRNDIERRIARNLRGKHPTFTLGCLAGFGPSPGFESVRTFAGRPIIEAAKFILENASSIRNFVYRNKDGEIARKMLDMDKYITQRPGYTCMPSYALVTYQGNLLNYVREVIDENFNELFVDTKDGVAYIRLRPFPFDRKGDVVNHKIIDASDEFCWENLTRFYDDKTGPWEIDESEVIEFKISRSKKDVYSIFRINPVGIDVFDDIIKFMIKRSAIDLYNLVRFGLKCLTVDIKSTYKKGQEEPLTKLILECRDRLRNWYVNNPIYGCGTLQIKGREDIRIGDRVYLPWMKRKFHWKQTEDIEARSMCKGFEYYVVGTKNRWQFGSTYETTLTLERGQNKRMLFSYGEERRATLKYIDENFDKLFKDMGISIPPTISV